MLGRAWHYASLEDAAMTRQTRGPKGVASASLWAALKCFNHASTILSRFGLTPSERSRLSIPQDDADHDPVESYRAKPSRRPSV
jgi:hypothetical protein